MNKFIDKIPNRLALVTVILFAAFIAYGLETDCPDTPGIYLKHCPRN